MKTLFKKELNYYLNNPIGYIIIILFAVFANFLFVKDIFVVGSASMKAFFSLVPWLFMIFIPALAMRSFAEEKRNNTIEVLLTLPLSETEIVLAKFFSLFTLVLLALSLTLALPISLFFLSNLYLPEIIVGYLGLLFIGSLFLSISLFFSSLTKNQVVAFLTALLTIFFLMVLGSDFVGSIFPKFVIDITSIFTPLYHLQSFIKGLIDFRSVYYFFVLSVVFLFLVIINLERRS